MILYFADRTMNILGQASTNLPEGIHIIDDNKTEDVDYGVNVFDFSIPYDIGERSTVEELCKVGNYVLRQSKDEYEVYTIIDRENETDGYNGTCKLYAEDAGLDLLNEVLDPYSNESAQPISFYAEKILYDSGFEIGINEITDTKLGLAWDSEETCTSRLVSLCNAFECEFKFSFDIDRLSLKHKYINFYKKLGKDDGTELRLTREINKITVKESIANLSTALKVTGGTPEGQEDPITLRGYSYDDGDIYVDGTMLKSRYGLSKWSRYLSESGTDVGHIVTSFKADTTNQEELFLLAYTQLLSVSDTQVNYELDLAILPDNLNIGDTVKIADSNGGIFLESRILKLETSEYNDTRKATLGDFLIKDGGISEEVATLAAQFKELASKRSFFTWVAYADTKDGDGISLDSTGKKYMGTAYNKTERAVDISDPSIFDWVLLRALESYRGFVTSSNGIMLKQGGIGATNITANVWYEKQDVTSDFTIKWYKDNVELGEGRTITVKLADMDTETSKYSFIALDYMNEEVASGEITISVIYDGDSITVSETKSEYQVSNQCTTVPIGTWVSDIPETQPGEYLWTKTTITFSDGTSTVSYSVSRNGQNGEKGDKGDPGETGNDGKGVSQIETEYYVSTSKTEQTGGSWSTDTPVWDVNKYLWIRYKITYINPDSVEYTVPFNDATWEVINRLNVSEVNLIDGTTNEPITIGVYPESGYIEGKMYYTNCILNSDEYVLSFDAKSTVADDVITCYLSRANENNIIRVDTSTGWVNTTTDVRMGYARIKLTTDWVRYWVKYTKTIGEDTQTKKVTIARLYSGGGTGEVQIRGVKLTKGNKTTGEWTASPNDLERVINSDTAPTNTNVLWCDTSKVPYCLYKYNTTTSQWELVNDYNDDLNSLKQTITTEYNVSIEQLRESIESTVSKVETITSENGTAIEELKSQVEQNESGVGVVTSKITEIVDEISGLATKREIQEWARFKDGTLILGSSDSPFSVRLTKTELGFYENENKIAFLSNQQLHIAQAVVLDKINVGDFVIEANSTNGLCIH